MRRHLPRLLLTGALLSPVTLYALGLGEIRLNSALNQPFDADIELVAPTAEELSSLTVMLASQDVFSRYGIDRPAFLSSLDFAVSRGRDGRASIKVTSNRSITEPFVTILVEASWARGRLVREYTVLLDPPVFLPSQPATPPPVTTPQSGVQGEGRIERAAPPPPPPVREPARPAAPPREDFSGMVVPAPGTEYLVQRNDTLYRIAESINPGSRQGVNQAMVALFRANPQAFAGNINRLRAGAVLRIPALDQIQAISGGEATAEVRRQSAEWSGAVVADSMAESRLRLVTPEDAPASPGGTDASGALTPTPGQSGGAGEDARLSLANQGLAQVQQQLDPLPEQPVDNAPALDPLAPDALDDPNAVAEQPVSEPLAEQPPTVAPTPEPSVTPPPPAPSLLERLGQYWWALIGLGLVVVLGAVLGVLRRRRAEEDDPTLDAMDDMDFDTQHTEAEDAFAGRAPDGFLAQTGMDHLPPARPAPAAFAPVATDSKLQSMQPDEAPLSDEDLPRPTLVGEATRAEHQDALAEADFHMAYGLYDQAAALVDSVLEREPQRRELYLKLLEIYFVWGNQPRFLETARYLHDTRAQAPVGEWDKVLIMGRQLVPGEALFQASPAAPVAAVDVNLEGGENRVDVDLFTEPGEPTQNLEDFADTGTGLEFVLEQTGQHAAGAPEGWPPVRDPTIREQVDTEGFSQPVSQAEQTAELAIDDLGLDLAAMDGGQGLDDADDALQPDEVLGEDGALLQDDEATQLAPSLGALDRARAAPAGAFDGDVDLDSTGTIYVDQVDFALGGDTVEQPRPGLDATAAMRNLTAVDLEPADEDLTQDHDALVAGEDSHWSADAAAAQSYAAADDETQDAGLPEPLDEASPGAAGLPEHGVLSDADLEAAQRQLAQELELSELEPVTMSEVGTKLDLARAYMDMGDPDGARSILDEVLVEGNASQKQEAQRLMDAIG